MSESSLNARQLVEHWKTSGLLPADREQPLTEVIRSLPEARERVSHSIQVLAGFGALLTAVFFIGFLVAIDLFDPRSTAGRIFWMTAFGSAAFFLLHYARDRNTPPARGVFFLQASFCAMLAAKGLWLFQTADILPHHSDWGWALSTLLMTAVTYHLYPLAIDRFLSSLSFLVAVGHAILSTRSEFASSAEILLNLYVALMFITAGVIFTHGRATPGFNPIGYAVLITLSGLLPYLTEGRMLGFGIQRSSIDFFVIHLLCMAALGGLIVWAAGGWHSLRSPPVAIAIGGVLLLGLTGAPGILLALALLVLGHARHDRVISLLGILMLPFFLWQFYYSMNLDLMRKSAVLVFSGGLLLTGRAYLRTVGYDREETA